MPGRLLLAQAPPLHQLGNGRCLLHVIQVPALEIFHQGQQGRVLLVHLGDEARQLLQPRQLGCPETPFSGHQLIVPAPGTHRSRLQDTVLADAVRQLRQGRRVKIPPGLVGIGHDVL